MPGQDCDSGRAVWSLVYLFREHVAAESRSKQVLSGSFVAFGCRLYTPNSQNPGHRNFSSLPDKSLMKSPKP